MSDSTASTAPRAVFLSYAHEDGLAARRIAEALREVGIEVWFDQSELRGGDAWDQKIRQQIRECALFVPIVSVNTQERGEGYFRLEWKLAVERTHHMAEGIPFLTPVALDRSHEADALVPPEFMRVHWTRLAHGEPTQEFVGQIKRILDAPRKSTAMRKAESAGSKFVEASAASAAPLASTPPEPVAPPQAETRMPPKSRASLWLTLGLVGTALAVIVCIAWWPVQKKISAAGPTSSVAETKPAAAAAAPARSADEAAPAADKSVAVLAFADLSAARDSEYFSDGISEELINALGKVPGLKVPARTSSFHFKGKDTPIPEIAKQLGVAYVIEGSVQRLGDKVKIGARLTNAADGFQVWTDSFTREAKDVFAVEEEIAGIIAKNFSLKLGASSAAATASVNPQALEFYLQANRLMRLRDTIFTNTDHVEELLNRALALEPNFARAQAMLAEVWVARGSFQTSRISRFGQRLSPEAARIETKARQAIALDPTAPEAHVALATGMWSWWDRAGAENEIRTALSLNPSHVAAHRQLGILAMDDGRMDDAIAELKLAVQLDPLSQPAIESFARALHVAGRYTEAIATYDRALALADSEVAREHKAYALAQLGQKEAAVTLARSLSLDWLRFRTFAATGDRVETEKMFPAIAPENRAYYLFMLGRTEDGLAALNPAEMESTYLHDVLFEPWYDPVREDPRFKKFLETLGITEAHTRAQAWRQAHPAEKAAK